KAWGMAGLRLGMAFAHPEIITTLNKIKPPYNINTLTQQKALEALAAVEKKDEMVATILANRVELTAGLAEVEIVEKVFATDANFVLARVDDAPKRYKQLIEKQVIVRNRSKVTLCDNCLRITVGTLEEQGQFIDALKSLSELDSTPSSISS
ncbi:MAG: aminotransferase class I/II-fold pyridoxal phosphate-dependent enzyme, partial [Bacteroidota bacterium]